MKVARYVFLGTMMVTLLFGASGKELAAGLGISAGSKAIAQWSKVFEKESKMEKLGIDKLSEADREALKKYLIDHAADSDQPEAAGL